MRDREYSTFMLLNAPGFGAKSVYYVYDRLKRHGLTVNDLFDAGQKQLSEFFPELGQGKFSRASLGSLYSLDDDRLYSNYQKLKHEQVHLIGLDDNRYPKSIIQRLGENAPPVLFCKGNLQLLNANGVSIVGSRDVSDFAILLTKRIANRLADGGFNVTSGLAKGVDTSAHVGALEANGTTTMVLSYGFNHLSIKKEIKEHNWERNTLFVSQFMPYEKFSGQNAMARNKLVCALSSAVIVISSGPERDSSGKMSGTFDAGLTALKYKIPLFVLNPELLKPNPPQGNNDLIRLGGIPLSNGNELVEHLDKISQKQIPQPKELEPQLDTPLQSDVVSEPTQENYNAQPTDIKEKILGAFNGKPLSVQEIIKATGLDWTPKKLTPYLKKLPELEVIKSGRNNLYKLSQTKKQGHPTLFP
jgi:DNA processing protein